ncbi:hypothetical protein HD599_001025 [Conyzicola lurida]|uniref:Transglutaminase superfamily protein n=1 Tax=Conyzicola lurida TaxID=1172621 RepID=A0A841AL59_9MICO|nr:transglutaminase domain-containing protein [Conyzicola lurida]MBB5842702.1 hypothetical protein [Conyzicola lurida]
MSAVAEVAEVAAPLAGAGTGLRPRRAPRIRVGFVVANTLFLWLTMGIASAALWPIYQSPAIVLLVVVTTVAGSAIAILGAVFRWSSAIVFIATVAAFLILGVPLAVPLQALYGVLPTLDGLWQLVSSVALGWKQLVTITLPVGNYQGLLVPAFVLVLLVSVTCLSTALRSRRGALAAVGPVVLFVVATMLGPDYASWPFVLSTALLVASLVWLIWRRWYARRAAIRALAVEARSADGTQAVVPSEHRLFGVRTIVAATLILAIASAAGVTAATFAPPAGTREVLRTSVEQPFDPREYVSPLSGFRRYLQPGSADETLFTVAGLPEGARIRIATLDSYDGIVYSVGSSEVTSESGDFTRVPYRFDQSALTGEQVALDVTVDAYEGVWVPSIGQLETVEFGGSRATTLRDEFYYNDTVATAAVVGGIESGDRYRITAVVPDQPSESQLAAVTPGAEIVPEISVLPDETRVVLDRYVEGVSGAGNRLAAMLDGLRTEGYVSHGISADEPASRSGHSADRITQLLTDQRMIGDAEQYAVTAALMASELGFASRVVFGFVPDVASDGSSDATSTTTATAVTGASVSAWLEVDTAEYGWVAVDPTPEVREIPEEVPEVPTSVSRPQSVIPPRTTEPERQIEQSPQETTQDDQDDLPEWLAIALVVAQIAGWAALTIAVLVSPFLVIIGAKLRRRRRRRRAADPLARISGGWDEYRDAIVDHGGTPPFAATRREVAASVGGTQPAILAAIADRAMFAPRAPSDEEADKVWKAVTELSAHLGSGATRWQRLKARVSTRSFGRRDRLDTLDGGGRRSRQAKRQGATP